MNNPSEESISLEQPLRNKSMLHSELVAPTIVQPAKSSSVTSVTTTSSRGTAASQETVASPSPERPLEGTTVLFDLDGTLLDTFEPILISMRYATRKVLGRVIPDGVLVEKVGQPLIDQMIALADTPEQSEILLKVYRSHNERNLYENSKPFKGVPEMIAAVKTRGATLGVVTSKRRSIAGGSLAYYGLLDEFSCFVGLEDSEEHKPNPAPLIVAAKALEVPLSTCVYIGDSPYDIQAAQSAKIPCIGVTWGKFFSREILEAEQPQRLIDSPEELMDALHEILSE